MPRVRARHARDGILDAGTARMRCGQPEDLDLLTFISVIRGQGDVHAHHPT